MNGTWIGTYLGEQFDPFDPDPTRIFLTDIARALSHQCRFTGHVERFYSVAQHSVMVSQVCDPEDALWGLMHDAAEAYLSDVATPVKHAPEFWPYRKLEADVQQAVCTRFGLAPEMPESVRQADLLELVTEAEHLFSRTPENWHLGLGVEPRLGPLLSWQPNKAMNRFIKRYMEITT